MVPFVTGIDRDAASIEMARRLDEDIEFILGDFMTHPFELVMFDHIASIAVLHHLDAALRPWSGCATCSPRAARWRSSEAGLATATPPTCRSQIAGAVGHRVHRLSKPCWEDSAPRIWPPPDTFAETRRLAERVLPGVRYRRLLLFRYSLLWTKPA